MGSWVWSLMVLVYLKASVSEMPPKPSLLLSDCMSTVRLWMKRVHLPCRLQAVFSPLFSYSSYCLLHALASSSSSSSSSLWNSLQEEKRASPICENWKKNFYCLTFFQSVIGESYLSECTFQMYSGCFLCYVKGYSYCVPLLSAPYGRWKALYK